MEKTEVAFSAKALVGNSTSSHLSRYYANTCTVCTYVSLYVPTGLQGTTPAATGASGDRWSSPDSQIILFYNFFLE